MHDIVAAPDLLDPNKKVDGKSSQLLYQSIFLLSWLMVYYLRKSLPCSSWQVGDNMDTNKPYHCQTFGAFIENAMGHLR